MRIRFILGIIAWAFLGTSGFAETELSFEVCGVVRSPLANGRVVIDHEEMPGYMGAMTMPFNVKNKDSAALLLPGDVVTFRFRVSGSSSWAENFLVVGREQSVAASAPRNIKEGDSVPSFRLQTQSGGELTEEAFKGGYTVMTFIFTRCPVPEFCPAMSLKFGALQQLIRANEPLADKTRLISVTLDPEYDLPEVLAEYGKRVGAEPGVWDFATGEATEIAKLASLVGLRYSGAGIEIDHTLKTALIGPEGRLVKVWTGNRWQAEDVVDAITSSCCDGSTSCCYGK